MGSRDRFASCPSPRWIAWRPANRGGVSMLKRHPLLFAALLALPFTALAQSQEQLIERYTALAGSKQNATSLVTGLRDGKQVTLSSRTGKETFTPPTGKMGYGNVDHALALAEASLQEKGITRPTPAQLEASTMEILDRKSTRLNSSHLVISYAVFCLKKKNSTTRTRNTI